MSPEQKAEEDLSDDHDGTEDAGGKETGIVENGLDAGCCDHFL